MDAVKYFTKMTIPIPRLIHLFIWCTSFLLVFSIVLGQQGSPGISSSASSTSDNPELNEDSEASGGGETAGSPTSASGSLGSGSSPSFSSNLGQISTTFNVSSSIQSQVLENNTEILQSRKTGKISTLSRDLAKFALSSKQTLHFFDFSVSVQKQILMLSKMQMSQLLDIENFRESQATAYFSYTENIRNQIHGLNDIALVDLLNQKIPESLVLSALTTKNLEGGMMENVPSVIPSSAQTSQILSLGENLRNSGNSQVYEELLKLSGGTLNEDWIKIGEDANILLQDYNLASSRSLPQILSSTDVLENQFYTEISSLYGLLLEESLLFAQSTFIGGRTLTLSSFTNDLSSFSISQNSNLVLSASELLKLEGENKLHTTNISSSTRVVLMSGGEITTKKGLDLDTATNDLVVAARKDILLEGVRLESAREVAIRSLRDITIRNATIGTNNLATVRAARDLNVDGLNFKNNLSSIIMEANTIRLSEVHFPGLSSVQLNSLKGAIDGRYPNFGTSIPAAEQIGRVNFIKNVTSGGNLINNRLSFDQFGGNISIGKIVRP